MKYFLKWSLVAISVWSIIFTLYKSHLLTPLDLKEIPDKTIEKVEYKSLAVTETDKLNRTCYTGNLDDRIQDKNYYIGILNTLCDEYGVKDVNISVREARGTILEKKTLAGADGWGHIVFYYNIIEDYKPKRIDMAHIINHEYIHLLMFKNMASAYTVDYKSTQLINSISKHYVDLDEGFLYPSKYAYNSPKEQIAEILGMYNAKRMMGSNYVITNFEQDLYEQFMNNI